jgi:energy-coupling factor transporter ATP-binding protein EcfA2
LISALTLDAFYGKPIGSVTLNGVPLNNKIFKEHCYVVVQHDKHWPYLTCGETLRYAAELYEVAAQEDIDAICAEIIDKMGLNACVDTRNAMMSGGQRRRLSIGIALLKQPTVLFLDEPTSGLDAASASNIMQEIVRVAKEERIVIICTIHQPSTKVYNSFDQVVCVLYCCIVSYCVLYSGCRREHVFLTRFPFVSCLQMIMSRGRQAFSGEKEEAIPYFESIGYPCPPATNPAEFFLDLVNSDFSDESVITGMLDTWEEKRPDAGSSHHKNGFAGAKEGEDENAQTGVAHEKRRSLMKEVHAHYS